MTRSAGAWKTAPLVEVGPAAGRSVGLTLARARDVLTAAGCDTPGLDAELLLAEVLHVDRGRLVIDRDQPVDGATAERFRRLLARREAREPVAYILGRRAFRRLTLRVDQRVLIPRPETELLVEAGLELPAGSRVVDVGTGSGAVALALKDERADLRVRGTDVSPGALAVARANAVTLGLEVDFALADLLEDGPADAVLANLPYVPDGAALPPEITRFEPGGALFAGADGLDLVRRLVMAVGGRDVRMLGLEIGGADQAAEVRRLLADAGWGRAEVRRDLAGCDRVVVGWA
ncbi:MAG TPA: peptide chain release factor N(5)-glutamine methyltransferase [Solirubrobacteraceae bacterium]|jgi:release factor glutamine methyltransferase|nr:peptide chain release factor N(5)-glutamine methyltransferase [Solirubrobacteraceae bacterium]